MRYVVIFSLFIFIQGLAAEPAFAKNNPFYESSLGLRQIDKILKDLKREMGDIPPEVEKIAIYQIRTDRKSFSTGVANYIQGKIETTFRDEGRRKVISPPELKTLTITSTDTSFNLTNTIPTMGELWKLGDKLRIDAFIEGSCGMSEEGDIMLNLKLIKHKTAEILWSGNYIAGPNKVEPSVLDLNWTLAAPVRMFPVALMKNGDLSDTSRSAGLTQYSMEISVTESLMKARNLFFTLLGGFSWTSVTDEGNAAGNLTRILTMQVGVDLLAVIVPKPNPERGYWLGSYLGGRFFVPFSFSGTVPTFTIGFRSQLSRQFRLGLGFMYLAGNRAWDGTGTNNHLGIDLESFAYEFDFLNYSF
ncbi:MAG: hypothetical protein HQK83_13895 [Fibrobacteria bacterium]|nr:hypothetical protein [Fibrobacteria bacterium]